MQGRVFTHHQLQTKLFAAVFHHRGTNQPPAVFRHKVDYLRRGIARGCDEVALVFAVFVVYNNHEFTLADIPDSFFNGV